jgi:hypothetical protein
MISVVAFAGAKRDLDAIELPPNTFNVVHKFEVPDDHGDYPETAGYTADNWEQISGTMEDSALWPSMKHCMDAVLDFTLKKEEWLSQMGNINIKSFIQFPKWGGRVFAVCGFVKGEISKHTIGNRIVIAKGQ